MCVCVCVCVSFYHIVSVCVNFVIWVYVWCLLVCIFTALLSLNLLCYIGRTGVGRGSWGGGGGQGRVVSC